MGINGHIILCEDYVSFEIAKLLKEKGFNERCLKQYYINGNLSDVTIEAKYNTIDSQVSAPTLQMAMKWLREVHNIFIVIEPHMYDYINEKNSSYVASVWQGDNYYENITSKDYPTYEEAVDSLLKYCLENLI